MKPRDESAKGWCSGLRMLAVLLVAGLPVGVGVVQAEVPTAADIAACNQEARQRLQGGTTFPTPGDEAAAVAARRARAETIEPPGTGLRVTQSADPQIHGMDGDGAQDAAYRAAYRVCMRRKGF